MKTIWNGWISLAAFCLLLSGCPQPDQPPIPMAIGRSSLTEISGDELERYVADSSGPVLVEFGVDFNCERCESMRDDVVRLAASYINKADIVRVDFTGNPALVAQYGGTVCPTYVLFNNGQPVSIHSFPTTIESLESELASLIVD